MHFTCYMTPYLDLTVLWYPDYCLMSPFFLHSEYYLLAFTTTVLLSLNYLKFANKNKIIPFRNFQVGNFQVGKPTSKTQCCNNVSFWL